jgi:hypothetical protein
MLADHYTLTRHDSRNMWFSVSRGQLGPCMYHFGPHTADFAEEPWESR